LEAYQARRVSIGDFLNKILGVQTRLYDIETGLRELSLIQEQRAKGYEFIGKKGEELYFAPKEKKGVAEALMGIHVPTLPEILGYSVPTPPELLGFGRMEPEHYTLTAPVAGFIGSFEQPVYTVAQWMGFRTPTIPMGYSVEHPAYSIGFFAGQVAQAYLIGKGIEKGVGLTVKGVRKVAPYVSPAIRKVGTVTFQKVIEPSLKYAVGPTRYSYYKSVGIPTFRHVTLPYYKGLVSTTISSQYIRPTGALAKQIMGYEAYGFVKTVVLPNILHPRALLGPTITYWKGYLPGVALPHIAKPLPISMLKSVYAPNIMQLQKVFAPTLSYARQAYMPSLPSLPSFGLAKPLPFSMLKSVYLPNISQPSLIFGTQKQWLSLSLRQQLPHIYVEKPIFYLKTQAFLRARKTLFQQSLRWRIEDLNLGVISRTTKEQYSAFKQWVTPPSYRWVLKPMRPYGKVFMGKARYYLRLSTPRQGMKPLWLAQETFEKVTVTGKKGITIFKATEPSTLKIDILKAKGTTTIKQVTAGGEQVMAPLVKPTGKAVTKSMLLAWTGLAYPFLKEVTMQKMKMPAYPTVKVSQLQIVKPKVKPKRKEKAFITPIPFISLKSLERQISTPLQPQLPSQIMGKTQLQKPMQELKQIQKQMEQQQKQMQTQQIPKIPRLQLKMPKPRGKDRGLYGKWFPRTHPIKTHEEMWQTFTGKPMRTKKRKKETKKRRKKRSRKKK